MGKVKKILLGVLLAVLTLAVAGNSILWYIYFTTFPRGIEINIMEDKYYMIDDVLYIRADMAELDPQKVENGQVEIYDALDIAKDINEAIERRDAKSEANSAAN